MSENLSQPILNPNVYLNYLEPSVAIDYEVARDIILVTFGALLWDTLSSLPDDLALIRTAKLSPVLLAYFSSRACALVAVVLSVLAQTGPVENCGVFQLVICIFCVLSSASASYLILKRVHAVFFEEKLVRHIFTASWIGQLGASTVLIPATLHTYYQIANTKHCINSQVPSYVAVAFYVPLGFDIAVFSAITHKIHKSHRDTTRPTTWRNFFKSKEGLPHFSRAVIQGGQQYYMITHGFNITRANMATSTSNRPVLQLLPLVPAMALTSAMACRAFRNLRLAASKKTEVGNLTTIKFAEKERHNVYLPRHSDVTYSGADVDQC